VGACVIGTGALRWELGKKITLVLPELIAARKNAFSVGGSA